MSFAVGESVPELYADVVPGRRSNTILLVHGGGVAGWMWRPLQAELQGEWGLIIPDLPGHDRSATPPYRSHGQTIDALVALLEKNANGPVTVVGFSLGAQLAVLLAARHPELVERAVVISAQAIPSRFPAATLAMLGAAAPLAKNERFARAQAKELFIAPALFDDYLRTSRSLTKDTLLTAVGENLRFEVPAAWASFPGDALVLAGERERSVMKMSARQLAGAHPRSECEIVAGCGHGIPLQRPAWLAHRLRAWMPAEA